MGSNSLEGYDSFAAMKLGPVKDLPPELTADLKMSARSRIHPRILKDFDAVVPHPYLPKPHSIHECEAYLLSICKHRGFKKRSGIVTATGAPSFGRLVAVYSATGQIPGTAVMPPGSYQFIFELTVTRKSNGEKFKLPCFRISTYRGGEPMDGASFGDGDAVSTTSAGANWQMFLWHMEKALDLWESRLAAWPYYTAAVLSSAMSLEAYLKMRRPSDTCK
jgi:hypothetical protein